MEVCISLHDKGITLHIAVFYTLKIGIWILIRKNYDINAIEPIQLLEVWQVGQENNVHKTVEKTTKKQQNKKKNSTQTKNKQTNNTVYFFIISAHAA